MNNNGLKEIISTKTIYFNQSINFIYNTYYPVLVVIIIALGSILRLIPLLLLGFPTDIPYNGGGLYYAFSTAILDNHFAYPLVIPNYSTYGVPFAYNPLIFYFIAFLASTTTISPLLLHIYLPTIFSILSVIAFWFLINTIIKNRHVIITSTFFYCILPQAFSEIIPGEGLVESFGTFLFIIGIFCFFKSFQAKSRLYLIFSGITFGILLLGSPGGAFAYGLSVVIIAFFNEEWISAIKKIAIIYVFGIILSIPWWMTVISHHGINTIINGFLIKNSDILQILINGFTFNTGCGWLFGALLCLMGFIFCLLRKRWLFPIWFIAIYLAGEISYIVPIIASILMAIGLIKFIIPSLKNVQPEGKITKIFLSLFIIFIILHGIGNAAYYDTKFHYSNTPISYRELQDNEIAFTKSITTIKENLNPSSQILLIGDYESWWAGDWLPVLIERPVINVRYGLEWTNNFTDVKKMEDNIIQHLKKGDYNGSKKVASDYGTYFTHVFAIKTPNSETVIAVLKNNGSNLLYENEKVVFFEINQ